MLYNVFYSVDVAIFKASEKSTKAQSKEQPWDKTLALKSQIFHGY